MPEHFPMRDLSMVASNPHWTLFIISGTMKRNPPSSQRTPGTSEKQRARRLHALKAEEMHRQRHRDIAAEQAQRQAALAQPVQAAPVYDPYRAAREAYMERQQQAALNAQRINEQLGRLSLSIVTG
eukprot:TRINITY_DN11199_c0_g3_i6.p4 TRINITY_DN11199_c0_g3~~TRINITY_DN11199_c0_g3_i6.p4  ORF type:complete len:126 (+),score=24.56 TRINITY_DN11199_c0_g3_i6:206-583(+)